MGGNYTHTDRAPGSLLTALIYNNDHQDHVDYNTPAGVDDASVDATAMQAQVDPGEFGTESIPTSLEGELQRIRFCEAELKGTTYWYETAMVTVSPYNQEWFG